jgi:hypothetical protein
MREMDVTDKMTGEEEDEGRRHAAPTPSELGHGQ